MIIYNKFYCQKSFNIFEKKMSTSGDQKDLVCIQGSSLNWANQPEDVVAGLVSEVVASFGAGQNF